MCSSSTLLNTALLQPLHPTAQSSISLFLNESIVLGAIRLRSEQPSLHACVAPTAVNLGGFDRPCGKPSSFERGVTWSEKFQVRRVPCVHVVQRASQYWQCIQQNLMCLRSHTMVVGMHAQVMMDSTPRDIPVAAFAAEFDLDSANVTARRVAAVAQRNGANLRSCLHIIFVRFLDVIIHYQTTPSVPPAFLPHADSPDHALISGSHADI